MEKVKSVQFTIEDYCNECRELVRENKYVLSEDRNCTSCKLNSIRNLMRQP